MRLSWSERIRLAMLMTLAAPVIARPNGAPIEESPAYAAHGGITPVAESDIAVVSEDLTITLRDEQLPTASARYVLRNPGAARRILFGVPLEYPRNWFDDPDDPAVAEGIRDIRITLGVKTLGCELKRGATRRNGNVEGWCIAPLEIPAGEVSLGLDYTLSWSGSGWPGTPTASVDVRYPLWPASHWKGPVQRLSIRVEMGAQAPAALVVSPPGATADGHGFSWAFANADLRILREVLVKLPYRHPTWRYAGFVRANVGTSASASSTLPPEGRFSYQPSRAVDLDPATAWCEGVPGDGVGEAITVRLKSAAAPGPSCEILDFGLVPGFARDEKAFQANGRVTKVRIESCRDPSKGFEAVLMNPNRNMPNTDPKVDPEKPGDHADDSRVDIYAPSGALGGERECVRLVILEVRPGAKYHDTCISEFEPRLYCRSSAGAGAQR
jgi:hypothetical protein